MSLSDLFIKRPIATTLLAVGLAFSGITAFNLLPVSPLPRIDFPTISIQAAFPGANPEIMATSIVTPLERQLGRIAGVTEISSASSLGTARIIVQFDLSRDIDGAARDVQAAINAAQSQLPADLPSNPTYRKVNPADAPIMIISLTSDTYSRGQMYDAASTILQQKLSQVEGVGQVSVGGSSLPAVRIELNPNALSSYGIGLETVRNVITSNNISKAKGQIIRGNHMLEILANDQLFKAKDYESIIIGYNNGAAVKLSDLAEITESVEDLRNAGLSNGKPSVLLVIFKEPGANIIKTVDLVKNTIPFLKNSIPKAIDLTVTMDRTTTIRASLREVEFTLLIATLLVILVVYAFLGNARAALVPCMAVPLSLLGTFGIMYLLGFSLDNLSLMALTIATGFVVDDAVVVLENISRYIENGMKPLEAAFQGTKEVAFTVLSMSTSLIAVFIPILLMSGIVGRLFREFAITLSVSILVSLVISLTVTPMMCSRLLKVKHNDKKNPYLNNFIYYIQTFYHKSLLWSIEHHKLMLSLTITTIILTIYLFMIIPKGFFPQQDTGRIIASIQTEQDLSFQATEKKFNDFMKTVVNDAAVKNVVGFVGGTNSIGSTGSMYISLNPLEERHISADVVMGRLRNKLSKISGAALYMQSAQELVIGGRQSNAQFQYTLTADNLEELNFWAPQVMEKLNGIPGIIDINSDQRDKGLQVFIKVDYDNAARFGITATQLDNVLYDAFGQRQVSTLYTAMNQYHVVMEVAPRYWQNPETLDNIYLPSSTGKQIPLSTFAHFTPSSCLLAVNHQSQLPSTTLSFNLSPKVSLGDIINKINDAVKEMTLPASINGSFQGTAQAFQDSLSTEPYLIVAALFAVYIVLGILYESLIHPITILSTLPSAGVGALLALFLTRTDLTIIALIGIILLIGIVKKNAIMMIDFALQLKKNENISSKQAIYQAALLRFRPIMMTTMAALLSAVPLALGTGVGFELRRPLGISIIGGLILSQALTLYTTPVIYLTFEKCSDWYNWQLKRLLPLKKFFNKGQIN